MSATAQTSAGHELVEPNPQVGFFAGIGRMWREAKKHRHLILNFVRRDMRVKYRNSAMGYFWSLLEPLLLSAVYFVLYQILAGKPDVRYALWVVVGVLTWGLFSRGVNTAVCSLTRNSAMIKQIYFPRFIFATAAVGSQLVMTTLSLFVAVPLMIYFEIVPTQSLLLVPVGLVLVTLLALGIGLAMAPLNVVNRDVEHFFRFLTRAGLYISPVMWTIEMVPKSRLPYIDFLLLNPMAVAITMIRNGVSGMPLSLDSFHIAWAVGFSVASFLLGVIIFQRYESQVVKKL